MAADPRGVFGLARRLELRHRGETAPSAVLFLDESEADLTTGLPIYDIYSFVAGFHAVLVPRDFGHLGRALSPFREC